MNMGSQAVLVETDYRVERATGSTNYMEVAAQRRAARAAHPSWWRKLRARHDEDPAGENEERRAA